MPKKRFIHSRDYRRVGRQDNPYDMRMQSIWDDEKDVNIERPASHMPENETLDRNDRKPVNGLPELQNNRNPEFDPSSRYFILFSPHNERANYPREHSESLVEYSKRQMEECEEEEGEFEEPPKRTLSKREEMYERKKRSFIESPQKQQEPVGQSYKPIERDRLYEEKKNRYLERHFGSRPRKWEKGNVKLPEIAEKERYFKPTIPTNAPYAVHDHSETPFIPQRRNVFRSEKREFLTHKKFHEPPKHEKVCGVSSKDSERKGGRKRIDTNFSGDSYGEELRKQMEEKQRKRDLYKKRRANSSGEKIFGIGAEEPIHRVGRKRLELPRRDKLSYAQELQRQIDEKQKRSTKDGYVSNSFFSTFGEVEDRYPSKKFGKKMLKVRSDGREYGKALKEQIEEARRKREMEQKSSSTYSTSGIFGRGNGTNRHGKRILHRPSIRKPEWLDHHKGKKMYSANTFGESGPPQSAPTTSYHPSRRKVFHGSAMDFSDKSNYRRELMEQIRADTKRKEEKKLRDRNNYFEPPSRHYFKYKAERNPSSFQKQEVDYFGRKANTTDLGSLHAGGRRKYPSRWQPSSTLH